MFFCMSCKKGPLRAAGAAAPKAGRALPSILSLLAGLALKHGGPWSTSASSATLDPWTTWTTWTTCSLEKRELSLELLQMLHKDTLPFALPLILAAVGSCAEAPVFFPGCCKKSVAGGGTEETSAQLQGQGQSGGPGAMLSSLAVPPSPFRSAQRSAAHHLQQLLSLAGPQEEREGSRAALMVFYPAWPDTLQIPRVSIFRSSRDQDVTVSHTDL